MTKGPKSRQALQARKQQSSVARQALHTQANQVTTLLDSMQDGNEYQSIVDKLLPEGTNLLEDVMRGIREIERLRGRGPSHCFRIVNSGSVCLNSFPRFISGLRADCGRCRVVHDGVRRLRRTQSRGGQLGLHRGLHLKRPASLAARRPGTAHAA